jgi:hypothetical protein
MPEGSIVRTLKPAAMDYLKHAQSLSPDLHLAMQAAELAGEIIAAGYDQTHHIDAKGVGDLVSEIDRRADRGQPRAIRNREHEHRIFPRGAEIEVPAYVRQQIRTQIRSLEEPNPNRDDHRADHAELKEWIAHSVCIDPR